MKACAPRRISLGALTLALGLALPVGVMGLFSEATTGERVDRADTIFLGRVASKQVFANPPSTVVEFDVQRVMLGRGLRNPYRIALGQRVPLKVGDQAVVLIDSGRPALLGRFLVAKNPATLKLEVTSPITGMFDQGIVPGTGRPVPLARFARAIRARKTGGDAGDQDSGNGGRSGRARPTRPGGHPGDSANDPPSSQDGSGSSDGGSDAGGRGGPGADPSRPGAGPLGDDSGQDPPSSVPGEDGAPVGPDPFEPNDTLATATALTGLNSPHMVTGFPTVLTGLTLTVINNVGDVDFFEFRGAELSILHASTLSENTSQTPDTFMGLFHSSSGDLVAWDDDGAGDGFSSVSVALDRPGPWAVAIESAPDTDLSFTGDEALTTGDYGLSLELEKGSYLWNALDLIMGVSADGTFIEDFIGFKEVGGSDVLLQGVPADGWGLRYDVALPSGVTHVYGGFGDHLQDPGFTNPALAQSLDLGPLVDANGFNRAGHASSSAIVTYSSDPQLGIEVVHDYRLSLGQRVVSGTITLQPSTTDTVGRMDFVRLLDVDLFGVGDDKFFWSFDPNARTKAFAVAATDHVGNVTVPANPVSNATGDMQAALVIHQPLFGFGFTSGYRTGFAFTSGAASELDALQEVQTRLSVAGVDTWVIAVDQDPDSGLWAGFGTGLRTLP